MSPAEPAGTGGDRPAPQRRPPGVPDDVVAALGTASEALEYVERARGHLYAFHQLMGRADMRFGDAADQLASAGADEAAGRLVGEVVGRNVLDGRWTFQVVEEFDDLYWAPARQVVHDLEERHLAGMRHVFESEMKERRRSKGRPGHEARPPAARHPSVEVDLHPDRPVRDSLEGPGPG